MFADNRDKSLDIGPEEIIFEVENLHRSPPPIRVNFLFEN
jgi:hypothetical protein